MARLSPRLKAAAPYAAIALAALAAHATALGAGFTWLDHGDIELGAALAPPSQWPALFTRGFARTGFYRPLMALSLSLDSLTGATWAFHLSNLVLHASAAVLCALAGRALGLSRRAALAAGLLFAVHPATAMVASSLSLRSEALLAIGLLGLIVAHRSGRPLAAALWLALAALSKETGLVLAPLFLAALEWTHRRAGPPSPPSPRRRALFIAEALALALCLGLRFAFAPPWRARFPELTPLEAVGTRLAAVGRYLLALLVPVDASACDAISRALPWSPLALLGLAALGALAYAAFTRRGPWLLAALALLPALQGVPTPRFYSPHYLYLPLALLALPLGDWLARQGRRTLLAGAAVLVLCAGLSLRAGLRYRSDETLFGPDVAAHPACREGRLYLGDAALARGELEVAGRHYEAALLRDERQVAYADEAAALQNLGTVRLRQGDFVAAESSYRAALARVSEEKRQRELRHNLAAAVLAQGHPGPAAALLEPETERPDAFPASLLLRARALDAVGRSSEAAQLRRRAER